MSVSCICLKVLVVLLLIYTRCFWIHHANVALIANVGAICLSDPLRHDICFLPGLQRIWERVFTPRLYPCHLQSTALTFAYAVFYLRKNPCLKRRQLLWMPAAHGALCASLCPGDATDTPWKKHELLKLLLGVGVGRSYG